MQRYARVVRTDARVGGRRAPEAQPEAQHTPPPSLPWSRVRMCARTHDYGAMSLQRGSVKWYEYEHE